MAGSLARPRTVRAREQRGRSSRRRAGPRARDDPRNRASPLRTHPRGSRAHPDRGRDPAARAGSCAGRAYRGHPERHPRLWQPDHRPTQGRGSHRQVSAGPALSATETTPEVEEIEEVDVALAPPWITILHNCDCHTFEDVVKQLIKAIACSEDRAWEIAWEVHNTGKSVVKVGPETECVRVGNILGAIGLIVTVAQS